MEKKLYKMQQGKMVCGVCAGLADYLKIDVSLMRIIWVIVSLCGTIGIWVYLACAIILPWKQDDYVNVDEVKDEAEN